MKRILTAVSLLIMFSGVSRGQALECNYGMNPCEAYAGADAVFVAKVTKIVPETIEIWQRDKDYDQTASVVIEKTYKGIKRKALVLHQLGLKNAPKFILGSRYLFYANRNRATRMWEVKPCGRTRMANYVQDDLHYLEGLPATANTTRIAGEVTRYDTDKENPQGTTERLNGIKIKIIGGGKVYEATTDANGVYEVYGAPVGSYVIQPDIPSGLMLLGVIHYGLLDRSKFRSLRIELKDAGCSGVNILLTTNRMIENRRLGQISPI
jgi:hypothetical protein